MAAEKPSANPEWCIVANLPPFPYSPHGPMAGHRSQKIFPAGAKLFVIGGFLRMGHDTITVVGFAHNRCRPVTAYIRAEYTGNRRARMVYQPAILRAIRAAECADDRSAHRWLAARDGHHQPSDPEYGVHLARVAASFQQHIHGELTG